MSMKNIPDKSNEKWADLIQGKLNVSLKNFFFQMKVTQLRTLFNEGKISLDDAIDDAYNLCIKFSNAKNMSNDIEAIFGTTVNKTQTVVENNDVEKPIIDKTVNEEPKITDAKVVFDNEYERKMAEILRQKEEIEERLNKQIKAREEAEKRAKLEKKRRLMEMERINMKREINEVKKETYQPKEIKFEKKEVKKPVPLNDEAKMKEIERQKKAKYRKVKKKPTKGFFQRWFNL